MLLKALARERLAAIRGDETLAETTMKQAKQGSSGGEAVFHGSAPCFSPMKHGEPQETAKNGPCFTVSSPRARNSETSQLPDELVAGLRRLQAMPIPRITKPQAWLEIAADVPRQHLWPRFEVVI